MIEEIRLGAKRRFPQVKEFFFDDDTFTDDLPRAEAIARELGKLGVTWSCNAKANVPRETLKVLRDNGLRLLLVGYETGNQQILHNIKKGMRVDVARRFTKDCHELGITIHGTFILGLPGETKRDDRGDDPLRHARSIRTRSRSRSPRPIPAPYLYRAGASRTAGSTRAMPNWSTTAACRSRRCTIRISTHTEIFQSVEDFYRRFYFRAPQDRLDRRRDGDAAREMMKRRLREGVEFFHFLRERRELAH